VYVQHRYIPLYTSQQEITDTTLGKIHYVNCKSALQRAPNLWHWKCLQNVIKYWVIGLQLCKVQQLTYLFCRFRESLKWLFYKHRSF